MSKNIEINIQTNANTYEVLYPKSSYLNMANVLDITTTSGILDIVSRTNGELPYSRISSKPTISTVETGSYIGTSLVPDIYNYSYIPQAVLITFSKKTIIPDILFILGDRNFAVFGGRQLYDNVYYKYEYGFQFFVKNNTSSTPYFYCAAYPMNTQNKYTTESSSTPINKNQTLISVDGVVGSRFDEGSKYDINMNTITLNAKNFIYYYFGFWYN